MLGLPLVGAGVGRVRSLRLGRSLVPRVKEALPPGLGLLRADGPGGEQALDLRGARGISGSVPNGELPCTLGALEASSAYDLAVNLLKCVATLRTIRSTASPRT